MSLHVHGLIPHRLAWAAGHNIGVQVDPCGLRTRPTVKHRHCDTSSCCTEGDPMCSYPTGLSYFTRLLRFSFAMVFSLLAALTCACNVVPAPFEVAAVVPNDPTVAALFTPAPRLPVGFYDYFGTLKTPNEARQMVLDAGFDANDPSQFSRIGLIEITPKLIDDGRERFFNQAIGDPFSTRSIFTFDSPPSLPRRGASMEENIAALFAPLPDRESDPDGLQAFAQA